VQINIFPAHPPFSCSKNNPEVLEKRKQRIAAFESEIKRMQTTNPGRTPNWDEERIMKMDRAALEMGKRCIMWDDKGTGFFLVSILLISLNFATSI
jgi:hypothetical protein